jgi:Protein of unknown function (DUF1493)
MVNPKDDVWERIVGLADEVPSVGLRQVAKKREFTRRTDLVLDLGLVGDDAIEFMDKYASEFDVKQGDYETSAYFDAEGLWLLPTFKKQKEKKKITLGMLYLAAKSGKWDSEKLNQAYLNNCYE